MREIRRSVREDQGACCNQGTSAECGRKSALTSTTPQVCTRTLRSTAQLSELRGRRDGPVGSRYQRR